MSKVIKEYFSKNQFNKVVVQEDIEKSFYEHGKIIEAIESLNLILAHEIMNNHLSRVFEWIEDLERKDRKSTRLNSSHVSISYAVFCLKKKIKMMQSFISYRFL